MVSTPLQALVRKLFSDEETRLQFESDPNSILSKFTLTVQEKKAVLTTYSNFGLVTGGTQQMEAFLEAADPWFAPEA